MRLKKPTVATIKSPRGARNGAAPARELLYAVIEGMRPARYLVPVADLIVDLPADSRVVPSSTLMPIVKWAGITMAAISGGMGLLTLVVFFLISHSLAASVFMSILSGMMGLVIGAPYALFIGIRKRPRPFWIARYIKGRDGYDLTPYRYDPLRLEVWEREQRQEAKAAKKAGEALQWEMPTWTSGEIYSELKMPWASTMFKIPREGWGALQVGASVGVVVVLAILSFVILSEVVK